MIDVDQVATLAKVSRATVSRAFSRPNLVNQKTRERVLEVAGQLGYQPNQLASALRRGQSQSIGLIISDVLNPGNALLVKGVQDAAAKRDYTVFIFNTDEDADKERKALETLRTHMPQGLIIMPTAGAKENLRLVDKLPVIELDRASGIAEAHTVMVNNIEGAKTAVQHLTALGHRRIGMVAGSLDISTALERLEGYKRALDEAGIAYDEDLVQVANHREEGGRLAAQNLLSRPHDERPTALFVGNNEMTIGAIFAARDLGLKIPQDLSIVGFDDSRWARLLEPSITVVSQPGYELAYLACETLLERLERGKTRRPIQ
ncbi:MAG: LacI family DNA-binding transcriptional regulator, partial [Deinococcales bacterium]